MASIPECAMEDNFASPKQEVIAFLSILRDILMNESSAFDDRIFQVEWWRDKNNAFQLEYRLTRQDAYDCVMNLDIRKYSHTMWEYRGGVKTGVKLFVFEGICKNVTAYVKMKIVRDGTLICCVGFHSPERKLRFPYNNST